MSWNKTIFFHGTRRALLDEILKVGLVLEKGRATFTDNPRYAMNYPKVDLVKNGILVVVKSWKIKRAKDSEVVLDKRNKIITGWPNRWRTEQYGYYSLFSKKVVFGPEKIVALFYYNEELIALLDLIQKTIISGKIDPGKIKKFCADLEKVLSDEKIQAISPKISIKELSIIAVYGMIRNLILREIRANYISNLILQGWKIHNPGQVSCDRWFKSKPLIEAQNLAIGQIINESFIPSDVRREFFCEGTIKHNSC